MIFDNNVINNVIKMVMTSGEKTASHLVQFFKQIESIGGDNVSNVFRLTLKRIATHGNYERSFGIMRNGTIEHWDTETVDNKYVIISKRIYDTNNEIESVKIKLLNNEELNQLPHKEHMTKPIGLVKYQKSVVENEKRIKHEVDYMITYDKKKCSYLVFSKQRSSVSLNKTIEK